MEEKERSIYDKFKDVVYAYMLHDPNAQAVTAFDRERKMKTVDEKTLTMFRESAEAGHPFSCYNLGRCYENGTGVEKDLSQAYHWYREAASGGDVNAWVALAKMFDTGLYVDRDPKEAAMWLERAAAKEHPIAMIGLGQKCARGDGVEKDPARAYELFTAAHEKDKKIGSYILGEAIGDGIGCKKDYKKAFELFQEAHDNHFALGTYNLGMMMEMGLGCEKDEKKGFEYIKKAADEDIPEAMYRIAFHYREGTSEAQQDEKIAFEYFKKAADKGFPPACVETGLCYENGSGVEVDKEAAFKYYEMGANKGLHTAIVCLGVCYRSGIGCEPDEEKAIALMEQAVRIGNTRAYHLLASFLLEDNPHDERAINLEMVAANNGFARAALFLGGYFIQDNGVGPDKEKAAHYFRLAAKEGDTYAAFELADILDTEENKDNEKIQQELASLYQVSADSGHPLAAYKVAMKLRAQPKSQQDDQTIQKEIHYLCIAAAGGLPEAQEEVAERSFWGDRMKVSIPSSCALYRSASEDLPPGPLTAKYALTMVILSCEKIVYRDIGWKNIYLEAAKKEMRDKAKEDTKVTSAFTVIQELADQGMQEARLFRPLARAILYGPTFLTPKEEEDIAYIETLPESREKSYVLGLLAAMRENDDPGKAIRILLDARENLHMDNTNQILGNLYYTLAGSPAKVRKETSVPVLAEGVDSIYNPLLRLFSSKKEGKEANLPTGSATSTFITKKKNSKLDLLNTAKAFYLKAQKNGEAKDSQMAHFATRSLFDELKKGFILRLGIAILVMFPICLLIGYLQEGGMTGSEFYHFFCQLLFVMTMIFLVFAVLFEITGDVFKFISSRKQKRKK